MTTTGASGRCSGNDSRCGVSSEERCQKLEQEGSDCKWRAAFSVAGSMLMTASDVEGLMNSPGAKMAVAKGIANATGVPSDYVDVDLTAVPKQRRLRALSTLQSGEVTVTYVVSVGADAPASVTATGKDVGSKFWTGNAGTIGAAISSSVDESLGAGSFVLAVQKVFAAEVVIKAETSTSSTTSRLVGTVANQPSTTSMLRPTVSSAATSTMSTTTATEYHDVELSGARLNTCRMPYFAICMLVVLSMLQ